MTQPDASRRVRHLVICGVVILAMVALLLFGRGILAWFARCMAARRMDVGAISAAQEWLARSARFDPDDGQTDLMQAACFRRLGQKARWKEALQAARQKGAPALRIEQEHRLGILQSGDVDEMDETEVGALIEAGASPHDVAAAFVLGYLARQEPERAKAVLDAWAADSPEEAHVPYMRGVYWRWLGDQNAQAQAEFEDALALEPRHESARLALAELLEEEERLDQALEQYVELATRSATNETAQVGMARVLRQLGGIDEARTVLAPLASRPRPPPGVVVEMAQIEFESGNYAEAERWFEQAKLEGAHYSDTLRAAATTFALEGNLPLADPLFARIDAARSRSLRLDDLRVRLAIDPADREAAYEWQRLSSGRAAPWTEGGVSGTEPPGENPQQGPAASGPELYALYCAACHGASGDGNGRAARHVFPKPRDLRTGNSRLVSTLNGLPTREDVEGIIRRGMPGTSMRAYDELTEDQHKRLAEEVLRLNREGIREQFINLLKSEGEAVDEDEVREVVELCTTPGDLVRVPPMGPPDARAVARGKDAYVALSCDNCHGVDGLGAWDTPLFDDKGRPAPPRDLVHEPFKGGQEPESIYLRILLGMPGSPHPACPNIPDQQLIDVVQYCRWLAREPKRVLTNHERSLQATHRVYLTALEESPTP